MIRTVLAQSKLPVESERPGKTLLNNSISHEIRTPLAVLQSATSSLIGDGPAPTFPSRLIRARLSRRDQETGGTRITMANFSH
jgi:K+-sensing histidine kinase KdpD